MPTKKYATNMQEYDVAVCGGTSLPTQFAHCLLGIVIMYAVVMVVSIKMFATCT